MNQRTVPHTLATTRKTVFGTFRQFGSTITGTGIPERHPLNLEVLEARRLQAGQLVTGAEADGDA